MKVLLRFGIQRNSHLVGKKALVTGSTQGIGLGVVETFLSHGLEEVVIHDIFEESEVSETIKSLEERYSHSPKIHYLQGDVRDGSICRQLVRDSVDAMNGLDILVNNAGIQRINPVENFLDSDWEDLIATNLSSCFYTISETVKYWRTLPQEDLWGRVVNIASVHGVRSSVHKAGYCSAKHGLVGLTKVVALELAEDTNITANAVCPGWVLTDLAEKQAQRIADERNVTFEEAEYILVSEKQPYPKFASTQDIGEYCSFLCTDFAQNITGSCQVIDGGWSAC